MTTEDISTNYLITESSDNDVGFEIFNCAIATDIMTCDHFQMRPANSYTDGFRFESSKMAKALTFEAGTPVAGDKWVDEIFTLASAKYVQALSGALALLITLCH